MVNSSLKPIDSPRINLTLKQALREVEKQFDGKLKVNIQLNSEEVKQMAKLSEEAMAYESKQTKNIADLEIVSVDIELEDDEFETEDDKGNPKTVKQKITKIDNEIYRVPNSVLKQLKVFLEDNPKMTKFKVKKTGQGLNTEYTVIPIL